MPEKSILLDINFHDTRVPVCTDFAEIPIGYAVLYGTLNRRPSINFLKGRKGIVGLISDKAGKQVMYFPAPRHTGAYFKLMEYCEGSLVWLLGAYNKDADVFYVDSCGKKEEFRDPSLLEDL